jgi:hypothetical protein
MPLPLLAPVRISGDTAAYHIEYANARQSARLYVNRAGSLVAIIAQKLRSSSVRICPNGLARSYRLLSAIPAPETSFHVPSKSAAFDRPLSAAELLAKVRAGKVEVTV